MITVCCIKWGESYGLDYTHVLYRAVREHLTLPHRFVCLTDHGEGLDPGIQVIPLPVDGFPVSREFWTRGMWPKLLMFREGVLPDDDRVLYLDLDVMIMGSLDPFIHRLQEKGGLHIVREWNPTLYNPLPVRLRPDRGSNSSVVAFVPGEQRHIHQRFAADPEAAFRDFRNDQRFINAHARGKHYWPHAWCRSFRRSYVWHYPLNRVFRVPPRPRNLGILVFHGDPKPEDLMQAPGVRWGRKHKFGTEPVPWVQEYWRRYLGMGGRPPERPAE